MVEPISLPLMEHILDCQLEITKRSLRKFFLNDFLASIVVFLVALPLCMGISIAAGLPVSAGIITGIVGGAIVSFFPAAPCK